MNKPSILLEFALAMKAKDLDHAAKVASKGAETISKMLNTMRKILNPIDEPFLLACLRVYAAGLEELVGKEGVAVAETMQELMATARFTTGGGGDAKQ